MARFNVIRKNSDMRKLIDGASQELVNLSSVAEVINVKVLEDIFRNVEGNTKQLVDAGAVQERSSISLSIIQVHPSYPISWFTQNLLFSLSFFSIIYHIDTRDCYSDGAYRISCFRHHRPHRWWYARHRPSRVGQNTNCRSVGRSTGRVVCFQHDMHADALRCCCGRGSVCAQGHRRIAALAVRAGRCRQ